MKTPTPGDEPISKRQDTTQHPRPRPSLSRSVGSHELTKPSQAAVEWNKLRSSLKKQSGSIGFDEMKCLSKSWVNDDLSDLKMRRLSHMNSVGGSESGLSGCSTLSETQAEF